MRIKTFLVLFCSVILVACSAENSPEPQLTIPSTEPALENIEPTATQLPPSATPLPTDTAIPPATTVTPIPTNTPEPTDTPIPTPAPDRDQVEVEPTATTEVVVGVSEPVHVDSNNIIISQVAVDVVWVNYDQFDPLQSTVTVVGRMAGDCSWLGELSQTVKGNTINLILEERQNEGDNCGERLITFEETYPLDLTGLPNGEYTVTVNGVATAFVLADAVDSADNLLINLANVETIGLQVLRSWPIRANILAEGTLPDPCTEISHVRQQVDKFTIFVELFRKRDKDVVCTTVVQNFSYSFELDLLNLPAGEYTIDVNGVTTTLTLDQDNVANDS